MDYNFGDIENQISIHDDLIIAGDDFESHDKTLIDVFERASSKILNSIEAKYNTVSVLIR